MDILVTRRTNPSIIRLLARQYCLSGLLLCLIVSQLSACQQATPSNRDAGGPVMSVRLQPVAEELVADKSTLLATLKSRKAITLQSQVPGQIEDIYVVSGQQVTKGAPLIKLDQAKQIATVNTLIATAGSLRSERDNAAASLKSLQASRSSKIATVEFCKAQLGRYSLLYTQGAVSHEAVDQHTTNLKVAQSDLESLESQIKAQQAVVDKDEQLIKQSTSHISEQNEQLRYYTVKAPLDGIVGDIPVKLGEYVTSSTVLTTVNQSRPLEAYVDVPTGQTLKLKQGLLVNLYDNNKTVCGSGVVSFISPQVNNDNQSVLVKAAIPNLDGKLRPGQLLSAQIVWKEELAPVIPTSSVTQLSGQFFVFVAETNDAGKLIAKQKRVELGDIEGNNYRVLSGLHKGEKLVCSGVQNLSDGMAIAATP
ncbi:MAG: efflux RND transporter periplasmic adaptor subunit [Candidatus Obscuribacterales bacterium]|nr:efflux RND transporter periplasmic adaptor subunit [Candidatus Obscuribacterales bacterium]